MGGSKLGLGPQQRGPAAAWAAQKSRRVTVPLCSALIRPLQGTVSPFGSSRTGKMWTNQGEFRGGPGMVRAEECHGEQGLLGPERALSGCLHPPMGRLLRPGSLALHRATRREGTRQYAQVETRGSELDIRKNFLPWGRLPGQAVQAPSWEVSGPNWTQP